MSFNEVAKEIVKKSIRAAICVDDGYLEPYQDDTDGKDKVKSQELFNSFRYDAKCHLDIHSYESFGNWEEKKDYLLENKDLMILDWELDQGSTPKYKDALSVLKEAVATSSIKFVVIHTNVEDLKEVEINLHSYFNMFYHFDKKHNEIIDEIKEELDALDEIDDIDKFIEIIKNEIDGFVCYKSKRNDIIKKFPQIFRKKTGAICKKVTSIVKKYGFKDQDDFVYWLECYIFATVYKDTEELFNFRKVEDSDKTAYMINNTVVMIFNKKDVKADTLFKEFSEVVHLAPNNFTSVLTLDIINQIIENFPVLNTKLSGINEEAFFYHLMNYKKDTTEVSSTDGATDTSKAYTGFYNFLLKSLTNELEQYCLNHKSKIFDKIEAYKSDKSIIDEDLILSATLNKELAKLAYHISCVEQKDTTNREIRFGDIFYRDIEGGCKEFFLCITPHCDCLRSLEKIKNNFHFSKGNSCILEQALRNAETGYYSFVSIDQVTYAIEWQCKPFTLYIKEEVNNTNLLKSCYCGNNIDLSYLTLLKENYTQRIANNSFGHSNRVGIDLPHIS